MESSLHTYDLDSVQVSDEQRPSMADHGRYEKPRNVLVFYVDAVFNAIADDACGKEWIPPAPRSDPNQN